VKYYIDTEFWERPGQIDIISLGLVAEDGRELYLENAMFDWDMLEALACHPSIKISGTPNWLLENVFPRLGPWTARVGPNEMGTRVRNLIRDDEPEFWGYYADYDWVVFCWLQGRMIDLPKGWPKWCRDLKQLFERHGISRDELPKQTGDVHNALDDARWMKLAHEHVLKKELCMWCYS